MLLVILHYAPAIICGVHAVRTRQNTYWFWLLFAGGSVGAAIYFFAVMAPDLANGRTGRAAAMTARRLVNPQADYDRALKALDETPTVGARIKAAQAAEALGRWEDAESQWTLAASGIWSDDPAVLAGHARALLELGRPAAALEKLEALQKKDGGGKGETALLFARAYEGLGRFEQAEGPFRFAADHVPGLEAGARYVAFMARTGRQSDAEIGLAELARRIKPHQKDFAGAAERGSRLACACRGSRRGRRRRERAQT